MKMLKAVAIAALVVGYHSTAEALGGPYSFKAGQGSVNWSHYIDSTTLLVARDLNGDGLTDPSVRPGVNTKTIITAINFLSNADGSYRVVPVAGLPVDTTTTHWTGSYFNPGTVAVGQGLAIQVNPALIHRGLSISPGPRFNWHGSTVGDVNRDGKLDLIGFSGGTVVYLGFNPGGWGPNVNGFQSNLGQISIRNDAYAGALKDLDGDGYPELITGAYVGSGGRVQVWKNNGGNSFSLLQIHPGTISGPVGTAAVYNNQGDILVYSECGDVCSSVNSWLRVFSAGPGGLSLKQQISLNGSIPWSKGSPPSLLDVNGDGKNDLVTNHYGNHSGSVGSQHGGIWLNNGNGTFTKLGTPIFANIPKSGMKGKIIPTHANKDGRIDWIVIYEDGSFGTLLSPAPKPVAPPSADEETEEKEEGIYGGRFLERYSITDALKGGPNFWQLSFVQDQLLNMQDSFVDNSKVMQFNDINMVPVFNFDTNTALTFGATKADEYGEIDNAVVGLRYGEVDVAVGLDNSLLGWAPGQSLMHIDNPNTRYINISHKKSIGEWSFSANATYAFGTANGSYGYVKDVEDFHALGFGANVSYKNLKLKITQPLRIEQGGLQFSDFIADMEPNGRHIDYTLQYDIGINKHSNVEFSVSYMNDVDHILGNDDVRAVAKYKASW